MVSGDNRKERTTGRFVIALPNRLIALKAPREVIRSEVFYGFHV